MPAAPAARQASTASSTLGRRPPREFRSVATLFTLTDRRTINSGEDHGVRVVLTPRSEEHTSELQSHLNLVCRLLLEKKKTCKHRPTDQIRAAISPHKVRRSSQSQVPSQ